jgi:hypothetical protein
MESIVEKQNFQGKPEITGMPRTRLEPTQKLLQLG